MDPTSNAEAEVKYSVRDRLAIQDEALKRIESKMDDFILTQIEKFAALNTTVQILLAADLPVRVKALETANEKDTGRRELSSYALPVLLTMIFIVVGVLGLVLK